MRKVLFFFIVLVIAGAVTVVLATLRSRDQRYAVQQAMSRQPLPVRELDPVKGRLGAKRVTVVMVGSFTCASCKQMTEVVDQLLALYPDDLRIVWKDFPDQTPGSYDAALAARCAQMQGRFWQYHDLLFDQQDSLWDAAIYAKLAQRLGLKADVFDTCMVNGQTRSLVDVDIQDAIAAQVTALPYFQIQDHTFLDGVHPVASFRNMLDEIIKSPQP